MNTREDKTAQATYIAGAGTSAWILGLIYPPTPTRTPIKSDYENPSDYRPTAQQEERSFDPKRVPVNPNWGDPGWGE